MGPQSLGLASRCLLAEDHSSRRTLPAAAVGSFIRAAEAAMSQAGMDLTSQAGGPSDLSGDWLVPRATRQLLGGSAGRAGRVAQDERPSHLQRRP